MQDHEQRAACADVDEAVVLWTERLLGFTMQVKKYLRTALLLLAATLLVVGTVKHRPIVKPVAQRPITIQQRAEHRIKIEGEGQCTATAVGPHALLTALHCDEKDLTAVTLDLSMRKFHLLSKTLDGRDHVIYIIDGEALQNFVPLQPGVHPAGTFERIYIYGSGGGAYPPQYKSGTRTTAITDVSEIDQADGLQFYSIPVIPGDSGSAIYGEDGRIIGVVTYKIGAPKDGNWESEEDDNILKLGAGFDVNFTAAQLTAIAVGQGDISLEEKKPEPRKAPRSIFDIFN